MERPLRSFEYLSDIMQSWHTISSDQSSCLFLVKKTNIAFDGKESQTDGNAEWGAWVQMEIKKGKWSKRWIELRNQTLFLGKSDKQRDQVVLCSLSSFDAYLVPQTCAAKMKTPKPFAFAVKSVDKMSLFENTQDYIHYFSVKTESEQDSCISKLMQCRSTLLRQLIASKASAPVLDTRANILSNPTCNIPTRSASRHDASPASQNTAVFAEGSLLDRRPSLSAKHDTNLRTPVDATPPPLPLGKASVGLGFSHIPQGREWEKLTAEERQKSLLEAGRKARNEGKPLLAMDGQQQNLRSRSKSIGSRK